MKYLLLFAISTLSLYSEASLHCQFVKGTAGVATTPMTIINEKVLSNYDLSKPAIIPLHLPYNREWVTAFATLLSEGVNVKIRISMCDGVKCIMGPISDIPKLDGEAVGFTQVKTYNGVRYSAFCAIKPIVD